MRNSCILPIILPLAKAAFRKQREAAGDVEFADRLFDACGFDSHSVAAAPEDLFRRMHLVCLSMCCLNHSSLSRV